MCVRRYLFISQCFLVGFLALCTVLFPAVFEHNAGASTFGDQGSTVVFYVLAFFLCSVYLCLAAARLHRDPALPARYAASLALIALFDLLVMISTFFRHYGAVYSEIHDDLGIALYAYELVFALWLLWRARTPSNALSFIVQMSGSTIGLLSILKAFHLLFVGQITGAIGFGLLLTVAFTDATVARAIPDNARPGRPS